MFKTSNFDKTLGEFQITTKSSEKFHKFLVINYQETATSHLKLEPDWASIMVICDLIRQNDIA